MSLIQYAVKRERQQRETKLDNAQADALAAESMLKLAVNRVEETRKARLAASKRLDKINEIAKAVEQDA